MDTFESVKFTGPGTYKYILLKITDQDGNIRHIVRGNIDCAFHNDIFNWFVENETIPEHKDTLKIECLGGGKVTYNDESKSILIFGTSGGFGKADHNLSAEIIQKELPDIEVKVQEDE